MEGLVRPSKKKHYRRKVMITDATYEWLSPNRKQVIDTLRLIDDDWVTQALTAVDDAFFEKAARIIHLHSHRLARKLQKIIKLKAPYRSLTFTSSIAKY